ncbi:MAG: TIGR01777 family oxidoreductase [Phycisphaeraceae bacterium]
MTEATANTNSDAAADGPVVIVGGSGFLGRGLARSLMTQGVKVIVVSRSRPQFEPSQWQAWDGESVGPWAAALDGAAAVVNVVGRSVDCRKTPEQRDEILRSRLNSVKLIGDAIRSCERPPDAWVQAASTHIYGDPAETCCDENTWFGEGFAPHVCTRWEAAYEAAKPAEVRGVTLRISFVLGRDGGPLARLARLARRGLGGRLGSGKQWMSWIHQQDLNRIFEAAIRQPSMQGIYNATSPEPVRNEAFMASLRRALGRPWSPPVPETLVRLGARWVMNTDPELALCGRRCIPTRLTDEGFKFNFLNLDAALSDLLQ